MTRLAALAWCLGTLAAHAQTPDEIWSHFASWVRNSAPTTTREKPVMDLYREALAAEGLTAEEAARRASLISGGLRTRSRENNALYWDAMFRFGGGPGRPLRLLMETVRDLPPGRAVDAGMGNGRNSLFLASLGWEVTGYDIAPEGLARAREQARSSGARIRIEQAGHREFAYGEAQWDLILLSYMVADAGDLEAVFGRALWASLRPDGRIVCEGNFCEPLVRQLLPLDLPGFRLELYTDGEGIRDGWAADNLRGRVIRAVIRRMP